jgi:hypothetical protein
LQEQDERNQHQQLLDKYKQELEHLKLKELDDLQKQANKAQSSYGFYKQDMQRVPEKKHGKMIFDVQ